MTPIEASERTASAVGAAVCVGFLALIVAPQIVAAQLATVAGGIVWALDLNLFTGKEEAVFDLPLMDEEKSPPSPEESR